MSGEIEILTPNDGENVNLPTNDNQLELDTSQSQIAFTENNSEKTINATNDIVPPTISDIITNIEVDIVNKNANDVHNVKDVIADVVAVGSGVDTDEQNMNISTENTEHVDNINDDVVDDDDDEDLEDGEIDDDDDDDVVVVSNAVIDKELKKKSGGILDKVSTIIDITSSNNNNNNSDKKANDGNGKATKLVDNIVTVDLLSDNSPTNSPTVRKKTKPQPVEDDYAVSIENAIASALKKKGIEPTMPKVLDTQNGQQKETTTATTIVESRNSRRRKRKKQREDKDKEKDKKRHRYDSGGPPPEEDDMDDYEMLNVRGGSPPPLSMAMQSSSMYKDYDSLDETGSSYDSYDSQGDYADSNSRRRRRPKKDKDSGRKRRDRGRSGAGGGGGGGRDDDNYGSSRQDKRNRRDSPDHRQEPRKMELCKFYLMECCAKREKCSYMHGDFPCKFYYLGMECVPIDGACKFSHGEPLTEQLRNILLKHLETAPKEILGNFKRISRESAIAQITKRHDELCKEFKIENTWSNIINIPVMHNRHNRNMNNNNNNNSNNNNNGISNDNNNSMLAAAIATSSSTPAASSASTSSSGSSATANIPSLLDMVIQPPTQLLANLKNSNEKQRKSRWTDGNSKNQQRSQHQDMQMSHSNANTSSNSNANANATTGSSSHPKYLDLKNLHGLVSDEHLDKLSQLGITNLQQVDQLTFGQMNEIGLTVAEIGEIQKVAKKITEKSITSTTTTTTTSGTTTATVTATDETSGKETNSEAKETEEKEHLISSNSNSNSNSSNVVMVDYSQYLKDSNIGYDRSDNYDDDEQLIIDDPHAESDAVQSDTPTDEKKNPLDRHLPPRLQITDLNNSLKEPVSTLFYSLGDSEQQSPNDVNKHKSSKSSSTVSTVPSASSRDPRNNPFRVNDDDRLNMDDAYIPNRDDDIIRKRTARSRSRSRTPTRSQSSTPEAQSPDQDDDDTGLPIYSRATMYDCVGEPEEIPPITSSFSTLKGDKDMRANDIDLRLPFQPVLNYTPATEIDGSYCSNGYMLYKVYEIDVPKPKYHNLRKSIKTDDTNDPRLRRLLGLPELHAPKRAIIDSKRTKQRKLSNTIASPESDGASPLYYTPPMKDDKKSSLGLATTATTPPAIPTIVQPRVDPRRAAKQAAAANSSLNKAITLTNSSNSSSSSSSSSISTSTSGIVSVSNSTGATKQRVEIRSLLQKSEWYKNLNSKFKIMVNQQLALVSTELKKFYQDSTPNKIFDIGFIMNNNTLQQILTNLGIYIDDNGEISHIEADNDMDAMMNPQSNQMLPNTVGGGGGGGGSGGGAGGPAGGANSAGVGGAGSPGGLSLPNMSQPPPHAQLEFLRAPPPNMGPPQANLFRSNAGGVVTVNQMNMQPFGNNVRPSLLGMPPVMPGNPFNPFSHNLSDLVGNAANNLMGQNPGQLTAAFTNVFNNALQATLQQQQQQQQHQQQRNFGGNQRNRNRRI